MSTHPHRTFARFTDDLLAAEPTGLSFAPANVTFDVDTRTENPSMFTFDVTIRGPDYAASPHAPTVTTPDGYETGQDALAGILADLDTESRAYTIHDPDVTHETDGDPPRGGDDDLPWVVATLRITPTRAGPETDDGETARETTPAGGE